MAQLNVRFPDAFYKQVQRVVYKYLEMDLSSFVRELFIDTILLYEGGELPFTEKALAAIGQKHRIKGGPGLVLTLADHWREAKEFGHTLDEEPTESEEKMWPMTPEELKNALRQRGRSEKMIEAVVGNMTMSLKEMGESLANDPELARIQSMTEEERWKFLMEIARDRMIKARKARRPVAVSSESKPKGEKA
jgi:hypothetical protein